jgi:hypothetical protein
VRPEAAEIVREELRAAPLLWREILSGRCALG